MARKKKVPAVDLSSTADQSDSMLLSLTPELRNKIFQLVLMDTKLSWNERRTKKERIPLTALESKNDGKPKPPALVVVCKQVYSETIKVLYHEAQFIFPTIGMLRVWLIRLSKEDLKLVKRVLLRRYCYNQASCCLLQDVLQRVKAGGKPVAAFNPVRWT